MGLGHDPEVFSVRLSTLLSLSILLGAAISGGPARALPQRTPIEVGPTALPEAGSDWHREVTESLARAEYHYSRAADGALSAPNRAQGLRSRIGASGLEVFPRETNDSGAGAAWRLTLSLSAWGRDSQLLPVDAADPAARENRVELARGPLVEWYVNDERGIEQGFTIAAPPYGGSPDLPLVLEMRIEGLSARLTEDRLAAELATGDGTIVLRYGGLHVYDAAHREVPAELAAGPGRLAIRIHDEGAAYPLHVDPILEGPAWTFESNQIMANLGESVATAGDVNGDGYSDVIIGAYAYDNGHNLEGKAWLYLGSASGLAYSHAWTGEGNQDNARFGESVTTAGDVNGDGFDDVAVGAVWYSNGEVSEGRAFVYLGSASGLSANPAWTAEPDQAQAYFGYVVAPAGDVNGDGFADLLVGAFKADNGQTDEGRAYLYLGSATGPAATPVWIVEGNAASANLGICVAPAGDVNADGFADVAVAILDWDGAGPGEGIVQVYHGSTQALTTTPSWVMGSYQTGSGYATCVATAGDVDGDGYADLLVSAPTYTNGQSGEGRVYLYYGSASGLELTPWTTESNQTGAGATPYFGHSVATAGDVNGDGFADFLIGALGYDAGQTDEGRAFLFLGSANGPASTAAWTGESDQAGAFYGASVATAGDVDGNGFSDVIIGATKFDGGQSDEGRAYQYLGSAAGLASTAAWSAGSGQIYAGWAMALASAGDVNADGFSDVVVGWPLYDLGQMDEGRAQLYLGTSLGLSTTAAWSASGTYASGFGSEFGFSVASAGDVNGDGRDDVVVGAPYATNDQIIEGRAFVFLGTADGLESAPAWVGERDNAGALYGHAVATAGDVNGDGFCDVLVGAPEYDDYVNDDDFGGEVSLHLGSATGLREEAAWIGRCGVDDARYGESVASAGDVDGDGFGDVILGAPYFPIGGNFGSGRAFVYRGRPGGLEPAPQWTADGASGDFFGTSVASAGDVNGDGWSDVIVGAPTQAANYVGWVYVYHGGAAGLPAQPSWSYSDGVAGTQLGFSVAAAGDVNADGFGDVILSAPFSTDRQVSVFLGFSTGLSSAPAWTKYGGSNYGRIVAGAGDVNSDGFADLLLTDPLYDGTYLGEGRALLHHGNGGRGLCRTPRQRSGGSIALHGKSPSEHEFKLRAVGRSPAGRDMVRLEWEVVRLGESFDGTSIERNATFTDTGIVDEEGSVQGLTGEVDGLAQGSFFHWRLRIVSRNPFFPRTPWMSIPGNSITETKLRTSGRVGLRFE